MSQPAKFALCAFVLIADTVTPYVPLCAVFAVYILYWNPPWFRRFLDSLGPDRIR